MASKLSVVFVLTTWFSAISCAPTGNQFPQITAETFNKVEKKLHDDKCFYPADEEISVLRSNCVGSSDNELRVCNQTLSLSLVLCDQPIWKTFTERHINQKSLGEALKNTSDICATIQAFNASFQQKSVDNNAISLMGFLAPLDVNNCLSTCQGQNFSIICRLHGVAVIKLIEGLSSLGQPSSGQMAPQQPGNNPTAMQAPARGGSLSSATDGTGNGSLSSGNKGTLPQSPGATGNPPAQTSLPTDGNSNGKQPSGNSGNTPPGTGGSAPQGSGGLGAPGNSGQGAQDNNGSAATGSGGSAATGSGGSTAMGSGGSAATGSGGSAAPGSGGNAATGSGGTTATGSGGSAAPGSGGSAAPGSGGSAATGSGGSAAMGSGGSAAQPTAPGGSENKPGQPPEELIPSEGQIAPSISSLPGTTQAPSLGGPTRPTDGESPSRSAPAGGQGANAPPLATVEVTQLIPKGELPEGDKNSEETQQGQEETANVENGGTDEKASGKGSSAEDTKKGLETSGNKEEEAKVGIKKETQSFTVHDEELESESSGHFMAYFLTAVVLCIAGYVIFHNKQKIIAFIVEGRSGRQRRRLNGAEYKKLQSNVEEVMPALDKTTAAKNFIY